MKRSAIILSLLLGSCSFAFAQSSSSGGSSGGAAGSGAGGPATLSNGATISGTGGSPGPNTSNALNHGTTGNNLGTNQTGPASTSSAAVDTPAANSAVKRLGNTDPGILKK